MNYQYDILFIRQTPNQPAQWFLASNPSVSLGPILFDILNQLGQQGWRVTASGDFGSTAYSEIVLMRP